MQVTIGKILSLLVAGAYILLALKARGMTSEAGKGCLALVFPLALIWFPEDIGNLTGYFKSGYVNVETPPVMISILGWLFLAGLPVLIYFLSRQ